MTITNLAQSITKHGVTTAVWYDADADAFVVQHEFLQLGFSQHEFNAFVDTLLEARENYLKGGKASFEQ